LFPTEGFSLARFGGLNTGSPVNLPMVLLRKNSWEGRTSRLLQGAVVDNGCSVAVKIQRPGIRREIAEDIEVLSDIARFADEHTEAGRRCQFVGIMEEFHKNLIRELDYTQEACNLARVGENLQEFPHIVVPQPVMAYSTSKVLTMDYIQGKKITAVGPLRRMDMKYRPAMGSFRPVCLGGAVSTPLSLPQAGDRREP